MSIVSQINVTAEPALGAPVLSELDVTVTSLYQASLIDQWFLDGEEDSLIGFYRKTQASIIGNTELKNDVLVTAIGTSTPSGIKTSIPDSHTQTVYAYINVPSTPSNTQPLILLGNICNTPRVGASLFYDGKTGDMTLNGRVTGTLKAATSAANIYDSWIFVALIESQSLTSPYKMLGYYSQSTVEGLTSFTTGGGTKTLGDTVGVGATYYNTSGAVSTGKPMQVAEFGVFNKPLSDHEITALYQDAKARMISRGFDNVR